MAYEAQELWWVAVEGSTDPSGGWFLLADPGEAGAFQIQSAFKKAGIGIMAAVDAGSLCALAKTLAPGGSVSWRVKNNQCIAYQSVSSCAEALADIKELYPLDRVLLVSDQDPVHDLAKRMDEMVEGGGLKDIRQDLRCPPRGLGSWGLARAKAEGGLSR